MFAPSSPIDSAPALTGTPFSAPVGFLSLPHEVKIRVRKKTNTNNFLELIFYSLFIYRKIIITEKLL
jgi:hypothetical protein